MTKTTPSDGGWQAYVRTPDRSRRIPVGDPQPLYYLARHMAAAAVEVFDVRFGGGHAAMVEDERCGTGAHPPLDAVNLAYALGEPCCGECGSDEVAAYSADHTGTPRHLDVDYLCSNCGAYTSIRCVYAVPAVRRYHGGANELDP